MRVLFVCTGNTCRSPMAAAYAADRFRRAGRADFECSSAGLAAWTGTPASHAAIETMAEAGIDLNGFRSTRVTAHLLEDSDLIVAMTRGHRSAICDAMPELSGRVVTLLGDADVPDPYGGSTGDYREVFDAMRPALDRLTEELMSAKNI